MKLRPFKLNTKALFTTPAKTLLYLRMSSLYWAKQKRFLHWINQGARYNSSSLFRIRDFDRNFSLEVDNLSFILIVICFTRVLHSQMRPQKSGLEGHGCPGNWCPDNWRPRLSTQSMHRKYVPSMWRDVVGEFDLIWNTFWNWQTFGSMDGQNRWSNSVNLFNSLLMQFLSWVQRMVV